MDEKKKINKNILWKKNPTTIIVIRIHRMDGSICGDFLGGGWFEASTFKKEALKKR